MYEQLVLPYTPIGFSIRWFDEFLTAIAEKNNGSSLRFHTPHYIRLLYELMDGVRKGSSSGEYFGLPMTPGHTHDAARMSGDYNKIHIGHEGMSTDNLIAHGFHGVTEALEALRLYHIAHGIPLQPKGMDIQFRQKVPLDGRPLCYRILPFHIGEDSRIRTIMVFTTANAGSEELKPAIIIKVLLETGSFDRKALGYGLYCGWLTSALLAETWPGCIFYKLTAAFGETPKKEESTNVTARIIGSSKGKNGQQHLIVATVAGTFKGEADIILPAE